jgi:hypothetical protein
LKALGAKPVDISGDDFTQAVSRGEIEGAESSFAWAGDLPDPGTFTANLTFYPKVNAVVVNEKAFVRLSEEQRETLREAAAKTLAHVLQNTPPETERAAVYCRNGGTIAFASEADVAAFGQTAAPVYEELEADPQTKEVIEQIRRMKKQLSGARDPVPEGCTTSSGGAVPPATSAPEPSEFPEGVYRADLPPEYLMEKGTDAVTAHEVGGLWTLTFEDGRWRGHQQGIAGDCGGPYSVEAGRISLRLDTPHCGEPVGTLIMSARWKLENDGLRFFDVRGPIGWGSKAWTKID